MCYSCRRHCQIAVVVSNQSPPSFSEVKFKCIFCCRFHLQTIHRFYVKEVRTLAKQETDLVLELHAYRHQGLIDCRESTMTRYLDLQSFILRSRVLKFYRQALRTARRAPIHARDELRQTMRQEIEKNRHCDDRQKIRFLLSEGMQRLKGLDEMLDMMGHN
ncbi:uncharacterized protein LOC121971056 isoform X2 [Zingiber officinale]|uniref:uncharacterized protein LOC121971056 isoform X2 n=1 Tax=Zingiber officinale TaxID=94328 RepID=UPI001C4C7A33|nr:uncharacterized protein LOC121971056 isoform X2 [Zingiber officinale]